MSEDQYYFIEEKNVILVIEEVMNQATVDDEIYDVTKKDFTTEFMKVIDPVDGGYIITQDEFNKLYEILNTIMVDNLLTMLVRQGKVEVGINADGEFVFSIIEEKND